MFLFRIILILASLMSGNLFAQSVESLVPDAPTSFQKSLPTKETELKSALETLSGSQVLSTGGFGRFSSLSMRGTSSKNISFSIEGIRLNSPAQGTYDFSQISGLGFSDIKMIQGGYSPFSTSLGGQIHFRLPTDKVIETRIGWGSYDFFSLLQRVPNASFSFESAKNDFLYESEGSFLRRSQNESLRLNFSFWQEIGNHRFFSYMSLIDRQLPPPVSNLEAQYQKHFQSFSPMIAYQGRSADWMWSAWARFETQENEFVDSLSHNQIWYSGADFRNSYQLGPQVSFQNAIEWTQDILFQSEFDSKQRHSFALSSSALWNPASGQMIHPRLRFEWLTDLKSKLSAHPGVGGIHFLSPTFSTLWNIAFSSQAPSFNELYYSVGNFRPNPNLKRENSIHGDLGWEWKAASGLKLTQAFFFARTSNTIVIEEVENDFYQSVNEAKSKIWGIENELYFFHWKGFQLKSSYTFTFSKLNNQARPLLAKHRFFLSPELQIIPSWSLALLLNAQSSTRPSLFSEQKTPSQFDLSLKTTLKVLKWTLALEVSNLLRQNLQRDPDYPEPAETHFKVFLTYQF
ncbi:MAG: TonB-dependent receptor plug domain-containing protein [Bdellovibrionota bacterium]